MKKVYLNNSIQFDASIQQANTSSAAFGGFVIWGRLRRSPPLAGSGAPHDSGDSVDWNDWNASNGSNHPDQSNHPNHSNHSIYLYIFILYIFSHIYIYIYICILIYM